MQTLINNQKNQPQPPIEAVPTSTALDLMPKRRNYIPWLLAILVLVVIFTVSLLILISKSKSKMTLTASLQNNWKTYQSDIFGISFSYPTDWEISKIGGYGRQPGEYDSLLLNAPYTQQELAERKSINLTEEKNYVFMTIHNFPKTAYIPKTNEFEKVTQKEILIDSLSATEYQIEVIENPQPPIESPYPAGTNYTVIYISYHDAYLVLEHVNQKDKPEIFRQILSTFQLFTKPTDDSLIKFVKNKLESTDESGILINKIEGDYASGTAGTAGGVNWIAAKKDSVWYSFLAGNGFPSCSEVEPFPVGIFGGRFTICYEGTTEVDRIKKLCEQMTNNLENDFQLCPGFYSTKSLIGINFDPINYITTYLQSPDKKIVFFWRLTKTYVNECLKSQGCAGHGQEELLRFDFAASNFKVVETVNSPDSYPPQDKSSWSKTNGISFSTYDGKVYYCENTCAIIAQDGPQPPEEAGYSYIENGKVFYMSKDGKIKTVIIQ